MKLYPPPKTIFNPDRSLSSEDITSGRWALYADVKCTECGKEQSVASAGSTDNGRCIRCGGRTA